jgi:branched-chain amino acid transport system permease protein
MKPLQNRYVRLGILIALLILIPIVFRESNYLLHFCVLALVWGIVAEAWNLIMGFAGIFSFAQIAFFTSGAFAAGLLTNQLGVSPWLGMLAGGIVAAAMGFLIGLPSLRLTGEYIAVISYALHLVLGPLIYRAQILGVNPGGYIWNVPALSFLGKEFSRSIIAPWYFTALLIFIISLIVIYLVIHSPVGKAFVALRDSEPLARAVGINQYKYKLIVFSLSALITGIAGGFYCYYAGTISTRMLGLDFFVMALIMVILGGLGKFAGGAIGAVVITFLDEWMRPLENYRLIVLGILVIVVMIYMPNGLMGMGEYYKAVRRWLLRRRKSSVVTKEI